MARQPHQYGTSDIGRIRNALDHIPADDRDTWLKIGMALKDELGDSGRSIWDDWSASCATKYNDRDQATTWRSFKRSGVTIASLFGLAIERGWQEHRNSSYTNGGGHRQNASAEPHNETEPPPVDLASTFTFVGDAAATPPRELIKGLIPAEGVVVTGGQSSAGKTFAQIHRAICLATTLPYFGRKIVERVGTAFVPAEGRALIPNRFAAALAKHSITEKLPIVWVKQLPDFATADGIKLFIRQLKALDERFRGEFGVRLGQIPIDTIAACFTMKDEDDNAEAQKICNTLRSIGDETGALLAPVHHYGKNAESGLRGASAWKGSADVIEGVLADVDPLTGRASNRELVCAKARDGEQGPISAFELEFVELGLDQAGEIYGSCCVVPADGQSRFDKSAAPNKGERAILDAINEALDTVGKVITPRSGMAEVRAAKVIDIKKEFDRRYVVPDADEAKAANAKRMAFKRALDRLSPAKFGAGSAEGFDWVWKIS